MIKKFLPQSLFGRFLLIIITPVVILQALSIYMFYDRHWEHITRRLAEAVAGEVATYATLIGNAGGAEEIHTIQSMAKRHTGLLVTYSPNQKLIPRVQYTKPSIAYTLKKQVEQRLEYPFAVRHKAGEPMVQISVQLPEGLVTFQVSKKRLFSSTTYIFVMWILGMSVILYAIAVLFMRNQIRPIRKLSLAADALGRGEDIASIKPHGAQEVRQAALAFKRMRDRIHRQVQQRTDMLSGVSHDLRTPLTRIKLQLAMMKDSKDKKNITEDIQHMETLIEGYLAYIRGEEDEPPQNLSINNFAEEIIRQKKREFKNITFTPLKKAVQLKIKQHSLSRAVNNVLNNACQYGKNVAVTLTSNKESLTLFIDDDGPGIPTKERRAVFQPFHRLEKSRNPHTGGIGLGLPIARNAMRENNGDIYLKKSPKGGLRVELKLPKK